jgi:drug/metabolite transporter (DMT)-like permease
MSVPAHGGRVLAVLALLFNALAWGLAWWPLRQLQGLGLHPLWATVLVYALPVLAISLWRPAAWAQLLRTPTLWLLLAAAGTTNAAFNWGVTVGDVVRVVLLFYLMPLWAVLLAWLLLGEKVRAETLWRVGLALAGAMLVLAAGHQGAGAGGQASVPAVDALGWPVPRNLAEWLGVLGGFTFALNNVMLRREAGRPPEGRALAMFLGGMVVSAVLALLLKAQVPVPPAPAALGLAGLALAFGLGLWFLAGNLALQYGATRLPAGVTAVVMVSEILFASVSAVLLGAGSLNTPVLLGAALIVGAAVLSARSS